jgi:hypothetical protein
MNVLFIPIEEVQRHLESNERQDIKVVAPEVLTTTLFRKLKDAGKTVKPEEPLKQMEWKHSEAGSANLLCESSNFIFPSLPQYPAGPFAVSFANELAEQDAHYHERHIEIYYSTYSMSAAFKSVGDSAHQTRTLNEGGAIIFGPGVIHKMCLGGLTVVIELPSVSGDKKNAEL